MREVLIAASLVVGLAAVPATAAESPTRRRPPTPLLIERAVDRGEVSRAAADRLLRFSLLAPERLPDRFRSSTAWDGTPVVLDLWRRGEWETSSSPADECAGLTGPKTIDSAHFHIHYTDPTPPLTIEDYVATVEGSWQVEVDSFGWAAPPLDPGSSTYLVVVAALGPGLFGFVSPTTTVGDNPATPWHDGDASASCMVLNANMDMVSPGGELAALQATAAHEFNHSIQLGYGALSGANVPDYVFIEGGATWMEDEVFDASNDNYDFLWPDLADDMGEYRNNNPFINPYAYWVVWRTMVERFGTGVPGGGEDVFQRFWEITSRNEGSNLEAMDHALRAEGTTLPDAYHDAAIALAFNRGCGGGYAPPLCLEEGPAYVAAKGAPPTHGSIGGIGGSFHGSLLDNFALNWITLPGGLPYQVRLQNLSVGGALRATVACDPGTGLRVAPASKVAGGGELVWVRRFEAAGCPGAVVIVTNIAQTAPNPSFSEARPYRLSLAPPPQPSRTRLRVRVRDEDIVARGLLRPPHPGERMVVRLFERQGRNWRRIDTERAKLKRGRRYLATFDRPDASRCRVEARFRGDLDHDPSRRSRIVRC